MRRSFVLALFALGCGARSELLLTGGGGTAGGAGAGGAGAGGADGGGGGQAGAGGDGGCVDGTALSCGSNVGACVPGLRPCVMGTYGACVGEVGPSLESCNGVDDDCDGEADEGFGLGEPCDGPDADLCADDVMTCDGCSTGPSALEVCNGVDDDCDGVVDADCEVGGCTPDLVVLDVVKSMPSCFVDAVQTGSTGSLDYPCGGGPVSATFGPIVFSGSVSGGAVSLDASTTFDWVDGCTWESTQTITGTLADGTLDYTYEENPIAGVACLPPCFAFGTLQVLW